MGSPPAPMANCARKLPKSAHTEGQKTFCALMLEAREKAGLTQQKLANKLDRPQSFIAKYENGERRLDVVEFVIIVRAIGADPLKILRALSKRLGQGVASLERPRTASSSLP